jgi:hypothetical protein
MVQEQCEKGIFVPLINPFIICLHFFTSLLVPNSWSSRRIPAAWKIFIKILK